MIEQVKTLVREHKKLLEEQSRLENQIANIHPGHYLVDGEVWEIKEARSRYDRRQLLFNHKVIQEAQT